MNRTEGVLLTALIVASIMLPTITIIAKELSVQDALQKGLIHLHINSSGGYAQNCIELKVHNISNAAIELELKPGVILDNLDEHHQDIIVAKTLKMKLKSNQTLDTAVYGFCCQSSNGSPVKGQKFGFGKKADTLMIKLCRYIDTHKIEP
jgi:hypothetical protein